MELTIDWSESASYRCTIEAPEGYNPTKQPWEQEDGVQDALWEALRDASNDTTRYDAEISHCKKEGQS